MISTGQPSSQKHAFDHLAAMASCLTPLQFIDAANAIRQSGDHDLVEALERSPSMKVLRDAPILSALRCEFETSHARLYSVPGTSRQRLLVGFTGAASRLMMPLPIIMQALPGNTDLLILHDPSRSHFRRGIWDGDRTLLDLAGVTAPIRSAYADTIALGSSGGGLPALRFARHAGLRRGMSFGGRLIDDTLRILRRETVPTAYDPLCACGDARATELILVHSADHVSDAHAARCIAMAANAYLVPIAGRSDHNVLWHMQRMGRLADLLEMMFSASAPDLRDGIVAWNDADLSATRNGAATSEMLRKALSGIWTRVTHRAVSGLHEKPRPDARHKVS
ncbi:MAG: hypothetical protein NTW20_18060 [Rhodobacterales bacterium]|nr:hypothetical protein [Rhodobacterales bacterium]